MAQSLPRADLEHRVAALVEAHRPTLAELVAAEVAHRTNGNGTAPVSARQAASAAPAAKVCGRCNELKPPGAFERRRNVCRACRIRDRERRAPAAANGDGGSCPVPATHDA